MILNDFTGPKLSYSREKLDSLLADLCGMVIDGQKDNPDFYGRVAAAVIDPDGRVATGLNYLYGNERIHAERAAIDHYEEEYGELPKGSIVVTTLSPCNQDTGDIKSVTCTEVLNRKRIKVAYCGYRDPTQHQHNNNFTVLITDNVKIQHLCKKFADTFLHKGVNEAVIWEDEHDPEVDEWLNEDVRQHLLTMPHLFENDDRYTGLKDFLSTHDNIKPQVGKSYAIVTIRSIPLGHTISIAKTTGTKELLDISSSNYIFSFGNRTRSIPKSKFNSGDLLSYTLLFSNTNQLEHFITLLKLKYSDWQTPVKDLLENFADGKGPGRPGDSQRHGIPKHATMAELEKASHSKGRKGQLARWQLNMRRGHKK
jgi:pyrimidine deaminase RibD-like protein